MADEVPGFEQALAELEAAVEQLESMDLTLEETLALFERAQTMAAYCEEALSAAELRLETLQAGGETEQGGG